MADLDDERLLQDPLLVRADRKDRELVLRDMLVFYSRWMHADQCPILYCDAFERMTPR